MLKRTYSLELVKLFLTNEGFSPSGFIPLSHFERWRKPGVLFQSVFLPTCREQFELAYLKRILRNKRLYARFLETQSPEEEH